MIKYIRQWMALRKRKKAVAKLENELQDRMTRIDETMELKEVSDVYAKYVCMMNSWNSQIGDMLSAEYCEVSFALRRFLAISKARCMRCSPSMSFGLSASMRCLISRAERLPSARSC